MSSNQAPRRKSKSALQHVSALDDLRASGLLGLFSGAPNLASSRRRLLKEKLRGKAAPAR